MARSAAMNESIWEPNSSRSKGSSAAAPAPTRGEPAANDSHAEPIPPALLLPKEAAKILRVSPKAFYAMVARGHVPGVVRYGSSIRVRSRDLLHSADQKPTSSSRRSGR